MDRRSWLWRRKSSEKSPGETESSGSVSSHSERYSDDQEAVKGSSNNVSPNHAQSPEVSSNIGDGEVHESVKSLTEKLSAALLDISAKEELVRQHAKVAEEAVSGWEQAETEVAALKQQLEAANQKNSALEYRLGHLDGALKECVRQVRQAREEQEEKVHNAVVKKTHEWESEKLELEKQLVELKAQMQAAKSEAAAAVSLGLQAKLEAAEKENAALKVELLSQSEDLQMMTLERELSNKAAETASKQHLESIKKVAKLEAECRRLRSRAYKSLPVNDHKPIANSICMESVTDSQSDSGERLLSMDNEPGCSDSWASALIAELDQFKNVKASASNLTTSVEIDLMDDFLEMERLVGLPEADRVSSSFELADSDQVTVRDSPLKVEALHTQLAELDEKVKKIESEKAELEMALVDSRNQLKASCNQLRVAEDKLLELQRQLDLANESKQAATAEVEDVKAKRKSLEAQLESAELEVGKLYDKVRLLEGKIEGEKALSAELKARLEAAEGARKVSDSQLESANLEVGSLHEMVGLLESKVEEERASSTEFAAKVQALEAVRKALRTQLDSAHLQVSKLHEQVDSLEVKAKEERTKSAEFATKVEAVEVARKALEFELETKHLEIGKLHDKVSLLEVQVSKEKALSAEFAAKCQKLESEILRIKRDVELWQVTSSNVDLKIKKEKELAVAAGKLAECQKTIASLGQQLKSLTALDEFVHETGKLEFSGGSPDPILHSSNSSENISSYTLPNGKERGSPSSCSLSRSSSTLSGFTIFLSRSRSSSHIEN